MKIAIQDVKVGERLREEYGDIDGLATSIQQYGLIHPIVLDDANNLVCGGRRLMAAERLGWSEIEYRNLGTLSDKERRVIELEENIRRTDLTWLERDRKLIELADTAAAVLRETTDTQDSEKSNLPPGGKKPLGRPPGTTKLDSEDKISDLLGVPQQTLNEARQRVRTVETYPFMQDPAWQPKRVLEARDILRKLPSDDRPKAAALISEPGIRVNHALGMLQNLAAMPKEGRAEVFRLNESEDIRERSLAGTKAAAEAPEPDPRAVPLRALSRKLEGLAGMFSGDAFNDELTRYAEEIKRLADRIHEAYQQRAVI